MMMIKGIDESNDDFIIEHAWICDLNKEKGGEEEERGG